MACFIAPGAEAIITTIVEKNLKDSSSSSRFSMKTKLSWLSTMLWGGSGLLALEHLWHGELTLMPPFLTAMHSAADMAGALQEIATTGVGMAILVTAVWGVMCLVAENVAPVTRALQK